MKTGIKHSFIVSVLITILGLMLVGRGTAQTFTVLHTFIKSDGGFPHGDLVLSNNTLFGTTQNGGSANNGTVFKVNTDGTGFTNLYSFTNSDGAAPHGGLILASNTLYGTTIYGGASGWGTVFKVNTDGTGFATLYSFTALSNLNGTGTNSDGANPFAGVILSENTLYGATYVGGGWGGGTVFAINTDGTGFTNLHSFTNSDGANPWAGLVLSASTLFGTAVVGGSSGYGTVFAINTDGTGFTNLHSFTKPFNNGANGDGFAPFAGLTLSANTLYGTAQNGGNYSHGTVFGINTDGTGFTNLHSFKSSEGMSPAAGLVLSGNTLYGTTSGGGYVGGTAFKVNTDGTGFRTLHTFSINGSDGSNPEARLIFSANTLYGTAAGQPATSGGTVFSIFVLPELTIVPSGPSVIVTWPTNATGFTLQSTTNLGSSVWTTNLPSPVVVNGSNAVTNPISGTKQFFRLGQ